MPRPPLIKTFERPLIIEGDFTQDYTYNMVRQVVQFVIWHSEHSSAPQQSYDQYVETLFYSSGHLRISCGKVSQFVQQLLGAELGVLSNHMRYITMHDAQSLDPASVNNGYLDGGHAVIEIWCPDVGKWAMFDPDKGMIPQGADGQPLSMLDVLHAQAVDFPLTGQDQFGKGPAAKDAANTYLAEARHIFAINDKYKVPGQQTYVFLYSRGDGQEQTFAAHFAASNPTSGVEVGTDEAAFVAAYYGSPSS